MTYESSPRSFMNRSRNLFEVGKVTSNSRVLKMWYSIYKTSSFVYALSVINTKSLSSGGYISSYFDAISRAVTPTSCSRDFVTNCFSRYLSIILMVMNKVSFYSLNFKCTSISQSTKIARILSLISD